MNIKALSLVIGTALFLPTTGAMAAPSDGVSCPSGSRASFSNNILKCVKTETKTSGQICPGNYPFLEIRDNKADRCHPVRIPVLGKKISFQRGEFNYTVPAKSPFVGHGYSRVTDGGPGNKDSFRKVVTKYVQPEGKVYVGGASKGVKCGSGFTPRFNNGTLKCAKIEARVSDCITGWVLDVNRGTDNCVSLIGRRSLTLPKGKLSRSGWSLYRDDGAGNRDLWKKRIFEYPRNLR